MNADMMDMVELLDEQIDDITEALAPLLKNSLQDVASKLPVVDKARLSVTTAYAIESLLFSYLKLNGINAKEHPVMRELTRVRGYVQKINEAQNGAVKRDVTLNKEVAQRFVKHDLAGNEKWDREHAEQKAKERANAHVRFEDLSRKIEQREAQNPSKEEAMEETDGEGPSGDGEEQEVDGEFAARTIPDKLDEVKIKKKNEEQVNHFLDTFKNHGVASTCSTGSKRKFGERDLAKEAKRQANKAKKHKNKEGKVNGSSNTSGGGASSSKQTKKNRNQ